jgi:hypothetical protein
MFCNGCGRTNPETGRYCRGCGKDLADLKPNVPGSDELTSRGIRDVIIGDGVFMVAIILSFAQSPVASMLWLLLLIPAFFFFGHGFADILYAKQQRRKAEASDLMASSAKAELTPAGPTIADMIGQVVSAELQAVPSVTERTTRNLSQ